MEREDQTQFEPAPVQQPLQAEDSQPQPPGPGLRSDGEALALHEI